MKKATLLKAIFGLALVLMVSSAWGQNTPNNTVTLIDNLNANYVEVNQDGLGNAAISLASTTAATASTHINYITVGSSIGGTEIVQITGTTTDTTTMYSVSQPAFEFTIPMVVVPDQILSPGSFNSGTGALTHTALKSTWTWAIDSDNATPGMQAATSATLTNIGSIPAGFATTGDAFTNDVFNQKVLNSGTTIQTFRVNVAENSVNSDYSAVLCTGDSAFVAFSIIASPTASENTTDSDVNQENCVSALENSEYSLVINLSGTPPFAIGYYINEATISGGATTNSYTYTYVQTGTTDGATSQDAATKYTGTLTGSGTTWKYTISLGIDEVGNDQTYTNEITMDPSGKISLYEVGVKWVNDAISRKSDRLGTLNSPNIVAESTSHMLFNASGTLAITMYPTPATGNIFTLPN